MYSSQKLVAVGIIVFSGWFGVAAAAGTYHSSQKIADHGAYTVELAQMKRDEKPKKPKRHIRPVKKSNTCATSARNSDRHDNRNKDKHGRQKPCTPPRR